ncbi:MAG TPA: DUF5666 domain-containing protein [Calditrichia bacterium]|nr:T9SS type A sorting domain-containing protein [Calditrichota bacterium]HQU70711.1 DUF5666 domain-containing protein [Calditrichia bacterium]HQV31821.1 DUF5666 domain-containing protein [Calditrichia bacterium]
MKLTIQWIKNILPVVLSGILAVALLTLPAIQASDDLEVEGYIETIGSDSLVVTGTTFWVDGSTDVEGENGPISFSDLQAGDYVEVRGDLQNDGTYLATRIRMEDADGDFRTQGTISAIGSDNITVNGWLFYVNAGTEIRGDHGSRLTFADLMMDMEVEIRAFSRADGSYLAYRIDADDDHHDDDLEIEGFIDSLWTAGLSVNGIDIAVDSNTVVLDDNRLPITFGDLVTGDRVEVYALRRLNNLPLATQIRRDDHDQDDEVELTAAIERISGDTLQVAGLNFITTSATVFLNNANQPITLADLQEGMIVEIRGDIRGGEIFASRVKIEDFFQDEVEIRGLIESLSSDSIVVRGVTFAVDGQTVVLDHNNQPISYGDLQVGMLVEIRGDRMADGSLLANRIKIEDPAGNEVEIRAAIDSLGTASVIAAGREFFTDANTLILDNFNNPITFADLSVGLVVEIRALTQPSGELLATRIKIENSPGFSVTSGTVIAIDDQSIVVGQPSFGLQSGVVVLNQRYQPVALSNISVGQEVTLWADLVNGSPTAMQIHIVSGSPTGIGDTPVTAQAFELLQNYPNPFNPTTTIAFTLDQAANVQLNVYNSLGQKVAELVNGARGAGRHAIQFDGAGMASGVYFYTLEAGGFTQVRKLVLMK